MYELIKLSENDYYIDCPAKMGIVKINDTQVVAIDSGSSKDAAKKLLKAIEQMGWLLTAVFCTHSHADHISGNAYLAEKTGCKLYAYSVESVFSCNTLLEPICLYGGFPFDDLRHKFLFAPESNTLPLTEDVLPDGMQILPLPGHSFNMVGFITKDNNIFLADSVLPKSTLEKYKIGYLWDVAAHLETLEMLKGLSANHFIPSHAEVCDNIIPLAQYNIDCVTEVINDITELLKTPTDFETLLQKVFTKYVIMPNAEQYALVGSTLRSYLAMLKNQGKINYKFAENKLMWKAE